MKDKIVLILTIYISTLLGQGITAKNEWTHYFGSELSDASKIIKSWGDNYYFILCREVGWNPNYFHNIKVMKIDSDGKEYWTKIIETSSMPDVYEYMGASVLDNNDVVITGQLDQQFWVSKIDSSGTVKWSNKYFKQDFSNYGCDICLIPDNEILITGFHCDSVLLMNLSKDGNTNWCYMYPHDDFFSGVGITVELLSNNRIIIGANLSFAESDDVIADKACIYILNNEGVLDSISVIDIIDGYSGHNMLIDMEYTNDHIYILGSIGFISFDEYYDYYVACLDTNYQRQWINFYGNTRIQANDLFIDRENNLLVCGYDGNKNSIVMKCDSLGNILWNYQFYDGAAKYLFSIVECDQNQYITTGYISTYQELGSQIFVQKISERPNEIYDKKVSIIYDYSILNYPNPFNEGTTVNYSIPKLSIIDLSIFDVKGQVVLTLINGIKYPGEYSEYFDASNLCSGMYIARIRSEDITVSKKMLLVK